MKKLMFAAAAIAAGAVFAEGDITSQNVVGYQQNVVTNGTQGVGVTFKNVGGEGTMADLIIKGYGESYEDQQIYCSRLDGNGSTVRDENNELLLMYWVDADYGEDGKWYGWYSVDWETPYNSDPLAVGEGIWLALDQDAYVQSSGEVIGETLPVAVKGQEGETTGLSQLCANPTPVTVTLGDVDMSGYGDSYENQGIYAVKLNTYGSTIRDENGELIIMYWVDADYGEDGVWYGWYTVDWKTSYGDVTFAPGEAMWLTADGNYYINWPSPLAAE